MALPKLVVGRTQRVVQKAHAKPHVQVVYCPSFWLNRIDDNNWQSTHTITDCRTHIFIVFPQPVTNAVISDRTSSDWTTWYRIWLTLDCPVWLSLFHAQLALPIWRDVHILMASLWFTSNKFGTIKISFSIYHGQYPLSDPTNFKSPNYHLF